MKGGSGMSYTHLWHANISFVEPAICLTEVYVHLLSEAIVSISRSDDSHTKAVIAMIVTVRREGGCCTPTERNTYNR